MIRLVVVDLVTHARAWTGVFLVAVAAGCVGAIAAGLIETGIMHGGRVYDGLTSASSAVVLFTAVTAIVVLTSSSNLAVALQRRGYALWQLVGIRPMSVGVVVLVQLCLIGAAGAAVGFLLALPAFEPLFVWTFQSWTGMQGISLHLGGYSMLAVTGGIAVTAVIGGLRGARRASRTAPIEALRETEPVRAGIGWVRIVLTVLLVGGVVLIAMNLDPDATLSALSGQAMMLTPLIAAALAAAGPVLFPVVLRAWTSVVPARASVSWFLARTSAMHRLAASVAAVSPLMVVIALAGGLYTTGGTLAMAYARETGESDAFELAPEGVVLTLGGPLLLAGVAAAATVFMTGGARQREIALLRGAGAPSTTILLAAVWEAVMYTATAMLLGGFATVVGGAMLAAVLSLPAPAVAFPTLALIAAGGFVLILAATLIPTASALRHEIAPMLAVE